MMTKKKNNPHRGSTLDEFLSEEGILDESLKPTDAELRKRLSQQPVVKLKLSPATVIRQERDRRSR